MSEEVLAGGCSRVSDGVKQISLDSKKSLRPK
jgi:hypothetical protein